MQHVASELIERINTYAGTRIVERLRFVQDHVALAVPALPPRRDIAPEPVAGLPAGELNDALSALLAAIRSQI